MKHVVQTFATSLLDHVRTSNELEIMLNYDSAGDPWQPGERQTLDRLKLAIKCKLKMVKAGLDRVCRARRPARNRLPLPTPTNTVFFSYRSTYT